MPDEDADNVADAKLTADDKDKSAKRRGAQIASAVSISVASEAAFAVVGHAGSYKDAEIPRFSDTCGVCKRFHEKKREKFVIVDGNVAV